MHDAGSVHGVAWEELFRIQKWHKLNHEPASWSVKGYIATYVCILFHIINNANSVQLFLGTSAKVANKALSTIKGYKALYMKLWTSYPRLLDWLHNTFLYSEVPLVVKPEWLRGIKPKYCAADDVLDVSKALQAARSRDITNRDTFVEHVTLITNRRKLCAEILDMCQEIGESMEEAGVLIENVNTGEYDEYFNRFDETILAP